MAITAKQLADGQLAAAEAAIYTAPAGTTTYIKSVNLNNTGAGANTCELWLLPSGGTARRICVAVLEADDTFIYDEIVLETGDALEGAATNANEVDYVISGAEET